LVHGYAEALPELGVADHRDGGVFVRGVVRRRTDVR
jgi:hypothetical protein